MSGEKLFSISIKSENLEGSQYKNQREVLKETKTIKKKKNCIIILYRITENNTQNPPPLHLADAKGT